jgi:glutathione S-transferase
MKATTIDSASTLKIDRNFDAPRARVFDALVKPDLLAKWFAPSDEYEVHVDQFDATVGGAYRIEMRHPDGEMHIAIGTIKELQRPSRLVYTWKWEGGEMPDTLVTWELEEKGAGTDLVLLHERFPKEEDTEMHTRGWTAMMPRLSAVLAGA